MGQIIVDQRMVNRCVKGAHKNANWVLNNFLRKYRQYKGWVDTTRQHGSVSVKMHLNGPNNKNLLTELIEDLKKVFPTFRIEFYRLAEKGNFTYTIE